MEKHAAIRPGVTPSVHSGRPSETTKDDEAVCEDELEKPASVRVLKGTSSDKPENDE